LVNDETFSVEQEGELLSTTQRILDCLDLSELPKELRTAAGMESALFLKEVLDRIELPAAKTYRAWLNQNGVTASRSIQPPVLR